MERWESVGTEKKKIKKRTCQIGDREGRKKEWGRGKREWKAREEKGKEM